MAAAHEAEEPGRFRRAWLTWRRWRHTRPFWGGLLVTLGGLEILASERAPLPLIIHIGLQGLAGYLTPIVLVMCGLLLLFHPMQRLFYSLLAIVLSLGSWVTSNLGGFFVGMLLGLIGGSLAFAWVQRDQRDHAKHRGAPRPSRSRPAGLDLIRGERPADEGVPDDRPAGDPADDSRSVGSARYSPLAGGAARTGRAGGTARGVGAARSAGITVPLTPLAPLAASILAAVACRGLMTNAAPLPALAYRPSSVSPHPSPAPSASPSAGPSPGLARGVYKRVLIAGMPDAPVAADDFSLTSRFATLTGLSYNGVALVPTAHGTQAMLKFSMTTATLPGIVLTVTQRGQSVVTRGSTFELSGNVELYTTRLSGYLGGVRVTFTAATPPSGLRPDMTLTSVVAKQPFATADSLRAISSQVSTG